MTDSRFPSAGIFWNDIPEWRKPEVIQLPDGAEIKYWHDGLPPNYHSPNGDIIQLPASWHEGEPLIPKTKSVAASPWSMGHIYELVERSAGRVACTAMFTRIYATDANCFVLDGALLSGPLKGRTFSEEHCLCNCDRDQTIADRMAEIAKEIGFRDVPDRPSALLHRPFAATFHTGAVQ